MRSKNECFWIVLLRESQYNMLTTFHFLLFKYTFRMDLFWSSGLDISKNMSTVFSLLSQPTYNERARYLQSHGTIHINYPAWRDFDRAVAFSLHVELTRRFIFYVETYEAHWRSSLSLRWVWKYGIDESIPIHRSIFTQYIMALYLLAIWLITLIIPKNGDWQKRWKT